ncbi:DHS-like NAD/FAD-binding domain-containing protein [Radiomyces spectabilis]|uniref:DHS-like NAD/FAD-binding domain-containing protein n=1 Tax=Radiomyces spectabilis TaxID=64574 RepID=UPI00222085F7|nr:DHS-like NAD/FAD-binding domain-containing protein [Radiomyces spectabilis]KAI8393569.1 DHS-like NAD/FAD-binding domain-containing protein [Radiomyces spectabilis]
MVVYFSTAGMDEDTLYNVAITSETTVTHEGSSDSSNEQETKVTQQTVTSTIYDHDFDQDYNEESDQDWAGGSESDSDASLCGQELLDHATFGADNDSLEDVNVDEYDDESVYKPSWTSYTDEEAELLQEEARQIGMIKFIEKYVIQESVPVAKLLEAFNIIMNPRATMLATDRDLFPILRAVISRHLRKRRRLDNVNTLDDVIGLLREAKNVMIVSGAGVSVSCGIPDFRSETGIYSRLQEYHLDDPQQMFDIEYFRDSPEIFYSFAKELYPSNYEPSPSHMFVKLVEDKGKLLRNYTQNIDTLEHKAEIQHVVNCHGSFATASCVTCGFKCDGKDIEEYIFNQTIPPCPQCAATRIPSKTSSSSDEDDNDTHPHRGRSIMKPDITFFGEKLPDEFDHLLAVDTDKVDLLIVMGSSLKVSPVSEIMSQIPHSVPQILINRTPITHMTFDVQLLGNADDIVPELCRMLHWDLRHKKLPGGSALSDESWKLSREGTGDEVTIIDPTTHETLTERKIWKYWRDGLYTFPGAVTDEQYFNHFRCDERGTRGSDDEDEDEDRDEGGSVEGRSTPEKLAEAPTLTVPADHTPNETLSEQTSNNSTVP